MAKNNWRGDAVAVADVWTITITGPATSGGTIAIPIGTKEVAIAFANTETASVVASRLNDALINSEILEFQELGFAVLLGVVTATMKVTGVPTILTATVSLGITVALANSTVATGPNFGNNAKNWSLLTKPGVTSDDVVIDGDTPPILYGLADMFVGSVASIRVPASWSGGQWGLPRRNMGSGDGYVEFRQVFTNLNTAGNPTISIGEQGVGDGGGMTLGRFLLGAAESAFVYGTGASSEEGVPAVDFGRHTAATPGLISCFAGSVGWGVTLDTGTTSIPLLSVTDSGTLYSYGYATTIKLRAGSVFARGLNPTVAIQDGTFVQQAGQVNAITADGGTVRLQHDQGVNAISAIFRGSIQGDPPVLDLTDNDRNGRKLSNTSSFTGGAFILDPYKTADLDAVTFDQQSFQASIIGRTFAITRAAGG